MIKNIVFDIGNVLVRFQPDEAMREIGIEENKIAALAHATYENPVWVELDRGVIPENEIIDEMVKVAPQYEADIRRFFKEGKAFVVKAFDYAADWIKELKSRGYKVYLLSNYPKDFFKLHTHSELSFVSLVDGKVISAMVGMIKPYALPFVLPLATCPAASWLAIIRLRNASSSSPIILRVPALVSAAIYNLFHALVANNSTHYLF